MTCKWFYLYTELPRTHASITDNVYIPARNGKQKGWQKNTTIYKNIIPVYTDKLVYI